MQIQKAQNANGNLPYFKGKVKFYTNDKMTIGKIISREEDKKLHDAFLKATQVEHKSFRYGSNLKNTNYFAYLNMLKKILNIDLGVIANKDSEESYEFSHVHTLWTEQPYCQISVNKNDNSTVKHEFEFIADDNNYRKFNKTQRTSRQKLKELYKRADVAKQWAEDKNKSPELSRELQIFQMLLNLAEYEGKDRFNSAEINELTGSAIMYTSEIPVRDLIKQLLNIGIKKGEPLTAGEIKNFLTVTALMNKNEQNKVIEFIKSLKENKLANPKNNCVNKTDNKSNQVLENADISKFINLKNFEFVYSITKCNKPDILAKIVNRTGITDELKDAPDLFVKIYELSKGNLDLIQDLTRCFYLSELDQIYSTLKTTNTDKLSMYTPKTYSTDYHSYSFSPPELSYRRKTVLEALGLAGKIALMELDTYVDVPTYKGSFEQGKRR